MLTDRRGPWVFATALVEACKDHLPVYTHAKAGLETAIAHCMVGPYGAARQCRLRQGVDPNSLEEVVSSNPISELEYCTSSTY